MEKPRIPCPQSPPLACMEEQQGIPRPSERYDLSRVSWGLLSVGHTWNTSPRKHPGQMPEPPESAPFNVEEQWFYSEPFPNGRLLHPISKREAIQSSEKAHFCRLYLQYYSFGHYPVGMGSWFRLKSWICHTVLVLTKPP